MIKLFLTGLFFVVFVDKDYDNKYNILLEQTFPRTGVMIALRSDEAKYVENTYIELGIKAECAVAYQLEEGNGKIGSSWRAEDDWLWVDTNYVCNAVKVYGN